MAMNDLTVTAKIHHYHCLQAGYVAKEEELKKKIDKLDKLGHMCRECILHLQRADAIKHIEDERDSYRPGVVEGQRITRLLSVRCPCCLRAYCLLFVRYPAPLRLTLYCHSAPSPPPSAPSSLLSAPLLSPSVSSLLPPPVPSQILAALSGSSLPPPPLRILVTALAALSGSSPLPPAPSFPLSVPSLPPSASSSSSVPSLLPSASRCHHLCPCCRLRLPLSASPLLCPSPPPLHHLTLAAGTLCVVVIVIATASCPQVAAALQHCLHPLRRHHRPLSLPSLPSAPSPSLSCALAAAISAPLLLPRALLLHRHRRHHHL
ncbi:hypothetical protein EDB86DRAFT_3079407 [Lactarius hatsudake]|nr:hypothetical protein EDB86DRAFT_3079407 [Lactarius hatsudake]